MSFDATHTAMTAASGNIATATTPASLADEGEAFPRLPNHLVVTHILRTEQFDDPADLARLPAVSRAMRDLVAETGLRFEELDEYLAVKLGCFSAVQRLNRGGRLSRQELLCAAAARSGQLEELTVLRANGCPWDEGTCAYAALGGQLEVLQWVRANGCPWDELTGYCAAEGGHLEVLKWARANGCPWDEEELNIAAAFGHEAMVRALIELGTDVNNPWDNGTTPLFVAAAHRQEAIVRALIELGADVNKAEDHGATPLFIAAQQGHEAVVRALIEAGADINKAEDAGATPLFIAAQQGHEAVVRALIEAGARDTGVVPLFISTPILFVGLFVGLLIGAVKAAFRLLLRF